MSKVSVFVLSAVVVTAFTAAPAFALPVFKKEWEERYITPSMNEDFKAAYKEASCNVCHVPEEKKELRNPYGMALSKLLPKDNYKKERIDAEPEKVKAEIIAAFEKVETAKGVNGESYGERLKSGKLPAE
jgi:hypothetical protein